MYAKCKREKEELKQKINKRRTENEMKKFYLHLQVEVFFGLSCKNLPTTILCRATGGWVTPLERSHLDEQGEGPSGWILPLYIAANVDNKSNSFRSTSFTVHGM